MMPAGFRLHAAGSCAPETRIVPAKLKAIEMILTALKFSRKKMRLRTAVMAGDENASTVATAAPLYWTENVHSELKKASVRPYMTMKRQWTRSMRKRDRL